MAQVAVLGYGTVGSGVVEVIEKNSDVISKRVGEDITVKYVLDLRDFPGDPIQDRVVHDYDTIVNDKDISIICETMGGINPAYEFTKKALMAGKSVCTSNKELVAAHGPELISIAKANNCNYFFEASVGGGIPIIRPFNEALTAEKIDCIMGILNGTTNYILSKMENEGAAFDTVLKEAQEKGYAERNPEADVEGYDAGRKIAILASLVYGETVKFEDVFTEGITKISPVDFEYAKKLGLTIKLIGLEKETSEGRFAMVTPRLIGSESPLAGVKDVFNGILVHSNMLDYSMYYGRGAGKLPTASAVVGDVIAAAKNPGNHLTCVWEEKACSLADYKKLAQKYFVRVAGNMADLKGDIEKVFAGASFVQLDNVTDEFAFVTEEMTELEYDKKAASINNIKSMIRM